MTWWSHGNWCTHSQGLNCIIFSLIQCLLLCFSFQGDLKQFLRISKSKDDKVKSQPISTKTKVSVECWTMIDNTRHPETWWWCCSHSLWDWFKCTLGFKCCHCFTLTSDSLFHWLCIFSTISNAPCINWSRPLLKSQIDTCWRAVLYPATGNTAPRTYK